jgi:2'-phosphotransferase
MTWLLRHNAVAAGVPMGADGYVTMADLLKFLNGPKGKVVPRGGAAVTQDLVEAIVATCPKQRFQLREDGAAVRATQGHSLAHVKEDLLLHPVVDPASVPIAVHGTFSRAWASILATGLNRGSRQHIHMAVDKPGGTHAVVSGARASADVFIYVDVAKAMADGIPFYRSENNVILTPGVDGVLDPKYFKRVECAGRVIYTNGG